MRHIHFDYTQPQNLSLNEENNPLKRSKVHD
jgi:hypothetical protein